MGRGALGGVAAVVVVLLMAGGPSGGDEADCVGAFGVGDVEDDACGEGEEDDAFFAVGLAGVDPFDGEGVAAGLGGVLEAYAVGAEVAGGLG